MGYQQYLNEYHSLVDYDDGSYESQKTIETWLNTTAQYKYGLKADEYYDRMMDSIVSKTDDNEPM